MEYSNSDQNLNEICAIYSPKIEEKKGSWLCNLDMDLLGVDVELWGYCNLLIGGIYFKPTVFDEYVSYLNFNGLLDDNNTLIDQYINKYVSEINSSNLEPIENINELDKIFIYRIK